MKYKKGMKFISLVNNANRTKGCTYEISSDSQYEVRYQGDGDDDSENCLVRDLKTIKLLIKPETETDFLDAFQSNFKEGV